MTASSADLRADAAAIFGAAVDAADPTRLVADYWRRHPAEVSEDQAGRLRRVKPATILVVGAGKAAARMALGCEQAFGAENVRGEVIVADGCGVTLRSVVATEAAHPLPDARGEQATRRMLQLVQERHADRIVWLVSGGASSLLVCPRPPVTLHDKTATTQLLLECGADIRAVNTVRKHLSAVKGGGMLRQTRAHMLALLLSDVIGDDPSTIGSGPTAPDDTTFADAWGVLVRHHLDTRVPPSVVGSLQDGMARHIAETVKPGSVEAARCRNVIIGSNRTALEGASLAARQRGWRVAMEDRWLSGDTTVAARRFAARIREIAAGADAGQPLCILAGGETTVRVRGGGRGGRNQEFALALAAALAGTACTVLSAGTDGIDGPTDAAGAFVDGTTMPRAHACHLDLDAALQANDSHGAFSQLGDLFRCGATGTNVMDIKIALIPAHTGARRF